MCDNHGRYIEEEDPAPLTLECDQCGQEFETMNHMAALCGPCRRKHAEALKKAISNAEETKP